VSRGDLPVRPVWHLLPSGLSVPFIALGTAWLLLFGSCSGVVVASEVVGGEATAQTLDGVGAVLGLILVPVSALLLFVSAVLAGRWAARGVLFAVTLLTLVFGWFALALTAVASDDPVADVVIPTVLYAVPVGIVLAALLLSIALGIRDVRVGVATARRTRVRELVAARGELDYATLASETGLDEAGIEGLLDELVGGEAPQVKVDADAKMVFSLERYRQKQRDLVSVVWGRGKATLVELADELRLSTVRLHELLVAAMQGGVFTGFFDPRTGEVVSAAAAELRGGRSCPSCGGQMDLAGHGLVVCPYCRAEVFLPIDAGASPGASG
jgi:hypothetical protein